MAKINGVLGSIDTGELGFTLMHEHVAVLNWSMRQAFGDWIDREALVERTVPELQTVMDLGVKSFVDLTPINLGRDIHLMREVAECSGIQMIAATGLYWTEEPWLVGWSVEQLVEWLIRDIEDGIQGTDTKAGIIKCATDHLGVTPVNLRLLQVAARLHRATGVPISTHSSSAERTGLAQQDVFEQEGVDLSRVVIGHCGDSEDIEYLEAILARGSLIGMDRFGLNQLLPMDKRVSTVATLCERGWAKGMVLSHDACCHIDWVPGGRTESFLPQWNYRHICDDVIPALRKEGVDEEAIRTMTVDNPRHYFERQGSY